MTRLLEETEDEVNFCFFFWILLRLMYICSSALYGNGELFLMMPNLAAGWIHKERICKSGRCEQSSLSRFEQTLQSKVASKIIVGIYFTSVIHLFKYLLGHICCSHDLNWIFGYPTTFYVLRSYRYLWEVIFWHQKTHHLSRHRIKKHSS